MGFNGAPMRLLCRAIIFAWFLSWLHSATAINLAELELRARDLNATNVNDIQDFIDHWGALSRGSIKARQYPPLASQLPVVPLFEIGKVRRQDDVSCTWRSGTFCTGDGKCCGPDDNGWCCPGSEACCQGGSSSGCCGGDGFCCGSETGFEEGNCCTRGQTCCVPSDGKPFCCDNDQTCNNSAGECINPTVVVTRTTTRWSTRTQTDTFTTEATTVLETTVTQWSTRHTTISNVETGTVMETRTVTITHEPTGNRNKRYVPALATPTPIDGWAVGVDTEGDEVAIDLPGQVFVIRPAPSLNALANALARRGISIERRATVTNTEWRTVESTTTVQREVTSTQWTTEYDTTTETDTTTVTTFENAKETVTETTTTTRHITAAVRDGDPDETGATTEGQASNTSNGPPANTSPGEDETSNSGTGTPGPDSSSGGPPLGTIIGASVGGGVGLILIALAAGCFIWRRRRNKAQIVPTTDPANGPPFMLPSEHSVSPPVHSGTPGTIGSDGAYKGPTVGYYGQWNNSPPPMQELSPSSVPAELRGAPHSPYPPQAAPDSRFAMGGGNGYQSFDHYSQGYYMAPGSHANDVPNLGYYPPGPYQGQVLELPGGQPAPHAPEPNNEQRGGGYAEYQDRR